MLLGSGAKPSPAWISIKENSKNEDVSLRANHLERKAGQSFFFLFLEPYLNFKITRVWLEADILCDIPRCSTAIHRLIF